MKKLTTRGGGASTVSGTNHVPQVTPSVDGASLLLSGHGGGAEAGGGGEAGAGAEAGMTLLRQGEHFTHQHTLLTHPTNSLFITYYIPYQYSL